MEMDLELKITRTNAEDGASTDFNTAKDQSCPVFVFKETDSMFILTADLKGFKSDGIKIDINQDGTWMTISGDHESVMRGGRRRVYMTRGAAAAAKRGFNKTFKIPNTVVLDRIKAKFKEEESSLKIFMPKLEAGYIHRAEIEEVKIGDQEERSRPKMSGDDQKLKHIMLAESLEAQNQQVKQKKELHRLARETDINELPPSKKMKKSPPPPSEIVNGEEELTPTPRDSPRPTVPPASSAHLEGGNSQQLEHAIEKEGTVTDEHRMELEPEEMDLGKDNMQRISGENVTQEGSMNQVEQQFRPLLDHQKSETFKPDVETRPNLFSNCFFIGTAFITSIILFTVNGCVQSRK